MNNEPTAHELNEAKKALEKLDMGDIMFAMSSLALKIISGKKIQEKEYSVIISIPNELADVFEKLADATSTSYTAILSEFAKEGFNKAIQGKLNETKKEQVSESPAPSIDLEAILPGLGSGILEGLGKIQEMSQKLEEGLKVLDNANVSATTKDSSEPNVPTGPVSKPETSLPVSPSPSHSNK